MSGWSMFNFEARNYSEVPPSDHPVADTLQKEAHEKIASHSTVRYHGTVVARVSGYREWEDDEQAALSVAPNLWDRVVIIQANDTADIGTARLYHKQENDDAPDELHCRDEYHETQDDGCHVGDKAASVMFTLYNFPCMANFSHPYDFAWQHGEWEDE